MAEHGTPDGVNYMNLKRRLTAKILPAAPSASTRHVDTSSIGERPSSVLPEDVIIPDEEGGKDPLLNAIEEAEERRTEERIVETESGVGGFENGESGEEEGE